MANHLTVDTEADHRVLQRDLRAIAVLTALLFGAIAGLWLIEESTGVLASLASRGA